MKKFIGLLLPFMFIGGCACDALFNRNASESSDELSNSDIVSESVLDDSNEESESPENENSENVDSETPDDSGTEILGEKYSLVFNADSDWLYEGLNGSYRAGQRVAIKLETSIAREEYSVLVNGEEITYFGFSDSYRYYLYTFTMPEEDVVVDLTIGSGFMPNGCFQDLLYAYRAENTMANVIAVSKGYGEYQNGLRAAIILSDRVNYVEEVWTEKVAGFNFIYPNSNHISVLYEGALCTLTDAYTAGYLTTADVEQMYYLHKVYFADLYNDGNGAGSETDFDGEAYSVVVKASSSDLYEPLNVSYRAGERVDLKLGLITDTGVIVFVNGKELQQTPLNFNYEYWLYTFKMPEEDVIIHIKWYDGFLVYGYEDELIEAYYRANLDASVYVKECYGEYASGACAGLISVRGYVEEEWSETVAGFEFRYENSNRIYVAYEKVAYTLEEAYTAGYLTQADVETIYNQHRELYSNLY